MVIKLVWRMDGSGCGDCVAPAHILSRMAQKLTWQRTVCLHLMVCITQCAPSIRARSRCMLGEGEQGFLSRKKYFGGF